MDWLNELTVKVTISRRIQTGCVRGYRQQIWVNDDEDDQNISFNSAFNLRRIHIRWRVSTKTSWKNLINWRGDAATYTWRIHLGDPVNECDIIS
jgi:hypothetical protein